MKDAPLEERIYRLRCVEAWSMVIPWMGFPLGELLKRFEPTSKAKYVAFKTLRSQADAGPDRAGAELAVSRRSAYRRSDASADAVGPACTASRCRSRTARRRLVVPWKYGFKSIKSIVSVRFIENEPLTPGSRAGARSTASIPTSTRRSIIRAGRRPASAGSVNSSPEDADVQWLRRPGRLAVCGMDLRNFDQPPKPHKGPRWRRRVIKPAVWVACLTPLALLIYHFAQHNELSANPVEDNHQYDRHLDAALHRRHARDYAAAVVDPAPIS